MTGRLRSTFQTRADHLDAWDIDLDGIVRQGDRRVRRRRVVLAGGLAALLSGIAAFAGLSGLAARDNRTEPAPAGPPAGQSPAPLSYAVGSVIHDGSGTIDVGIHVEAFVRTVDGYVFSGPARTVYAEVHGNVRPIGHLGASPDTRLVAADDGHSVGWWDGSSFQLWPGHGGRTDSIDVGTRTSSVPPNMIAISDEHVWMWNGGQTWVADKPASDAVYQRYRGFPGYTVQDAAAGRLLIRFDLGMAVVDEPGPVQANAPGTELDPSHVRPQVVGVPDGDLSPDGQHWFTADGHGRDAFVVFDSGSGRARTPRFDGGHVTPYAWLDDDTIAAWTQPGVGGYNPNPVTLLRCRLSTAVCRVAAHDIGSFGGIALDGLSVS